METDETTHALTPETTGRWVVTTRNGTQHLFDLDTGTYTRIPAGTNAFSHDGETIELTRIEAWPAVGEHFLIWFDDPNVPHALEHWRQSSTIVSITRADTLSDPLLLHKKAQGTPVSSRSASR